MVFSLLLVKDWCLFLIQWDWSCLVAFLSNGAEIDFVIYIISVSQIEIENLHFGGPDQNSFYCRFGCVSVSVLVLVLENTWSKRYGLIQLRLRLRSSYQICTFYILLWRVWRSLMTYEGNGRVPCPCMCYWLLMPYICPFWILNNIAR